MFSARPGVGVIYSLRMICTTPIFFHALGDLAAGVLRQMWNQNLLRHTVNIKCVSSHMYTGI